MKATDQALLLRRFPFGESSLVVHALTRHHGRVHLLAKGAYRPKTRFSGVLDLFDTLDLGWSQDPRRELGTLHEGDIRCRRRALSTDLERYHAGLSILELADLGARPAHPDPDLFAATARALDRLTAGRDPRRVRVAYDLHFLAAMGLVPALSTCASCGGPAPPLGSDRRRAAFSAGAGGRLCSPCASEARRSGRRVGTLPVAVLEGALALSRAEDDELTELPLPPALLSQLLDFSDRFLEYHLETRPRTRRRAKRSRARPLQKR